MKLKVSREQVWVVSLQDRPGALAKKLRALAEGSANLEFVIARRTSKKKAGGVAFVTPLRGARQMAAAKKAKLKKASSLHGVRVEGPDKRGLGAMITEAVADAGLNLRGLSAAAIGKRMVANLAFDSEGDAAKAMRVLRNL